MFSTPRERPRVPGNLPTKHIFAGETRLVSKTDAIYMQNPAVSYYHPDPLGTTSYTTSWSQNAANGNQDLLQHERYFAFGELWRPGAEQEECDLGRPDNLRREYTFTSKEWDVDTSLYYFGARYFDPHADVWQSPDPMLKHYIEGRSAATVYQPMNLGLYTYAWNNPVVLKDPTGGCVEDLCVGEAAAVGAFLATPTGQRVLAGTGALLTAGVAIATGVADHAWTGIRNWFSKSKPAAPPVPPVTANRDKGKAHEEKVAQDLVDEGRTDIAREVTVRTPSGTRFRPDFLSKDKGVPKADEAKSSPTAPLTPGQKKGIPEMAKDGAEVVGKGKPGWPGGTKIPPTTTTIRRP